MSEYKFIQNGNELDYATKAVAIEKTIVVDVQTSLWKSTGVRLTVEELTALGLQLKYYPTQHKARRDYDHITALYGLVPEFATRVSEWNDMYKELGLQPSATVAEIEAAEEEKFKDDETARGQFHDRFMGKRTEVMVNYQAAERLYCGATEEEFTPCDDYTMWTDFAALVKWLPGTYEEADIPAKREIMIVTSSAQEEELRKEDQEIEEEDAAFKQANEQAAE